MKNRDVREENRIESPDADIFSRFPFDQIYSSQSFNAKVECLSLTCFFSILESILPEEEGVIPRACESTEAVSRAVADTAAAADASRACVSTDDVLDSALPAWKPSPVPVIA